MHPVRADPDPVTAHLHVASRYTQEKSAARLAFWRSASCERCRNSDNSSSLIVPFIPSSNRSWFDEDRRFRPRRRGSCQPVHRTRSACASRGHCGRDAKPRSRARHRPCLRRPPDQTIESGSDGSATGAAKIVVNDLDARPAELTGSIGERILALPASVIVCELIGSRLANVDIGAARQMLSGEKICAQFVVLWTDPDNRSMATSGRGSGVVG
jgi:hypothetical protein